MTLGMTIRYSFRQLAVSLELQEDEGKDTDKDKNEDEVLMLGLGHRSGRPQVPYRDVPPSFSTSVVSIVIQLILWRHLP